MPGYKYFFWYPLSLWSIYTGNFCFVSETCVDFSPKLDILIVKIFI